MHGVAPYKRLLTAADLQFPDRTTVNSVAAYIGWHRQKLEEAGNVVVAWACDLPVYARVNHGRWIADCPNCHSGAFTNPEWKIACCGECGCVMGQVMFPVEAGAITALLLKRSVRATQNWFPSETVMDLSRENAANGVV